MSYLDGNSTYPGAIDTPAPVVQGFDYTPEWALWLQDMSIQQQTALGTNPQATSGSVADRLNTGTFPQLNIAGEAVINDSANIGASATKSTRIQAAGDPPLVLVRNDVGGMNMFAFENNGITRWRCVTNATGYPMLFQNENNLAVITCTQAQTVDIGSPTTQPAPTAGDLNAVRLFSNGTEVTCYVLEKAYGVFDQAEWNALTAPKVERDTEGTIIRSTPQDHEPAKAFDARNDLDLEDWCTRLKARKALPNFPAKAEWPAFGQMDLGAWCQKLLEVVEIQAVHIEQLHERVKALESA